MRNRKTNKKGMLPIAILFGIMVFFMFAILMLKACKKLGPEDLDLDEEDIKNSCPEIAWQDMPGNPVCDDTDDCKKFAVQRGVTQTFQSKCNKPQLPDKVHGMRGD